MCRPRHSVRGLFGDLAAKDLSATVAKFSRLTELRCVERGGGCAASADAVLTRYPRRLPHCRVTPIGASTLAAGLKKLPSLRVVVYVAASLPDRSASLRATPQHWPCHEPPR